MTIKEKIQHAKKYSYPVKVAFDGCGREGAVVAVKDDRFSLSDAITGWHEYSSVASVEPLESSCMPYNENPYDHILWRLEYNSTDMGEIGKYVKWEYIKNYVEEARKRFDGQKVKLDIILGQVGSIVTVDLSKLYEEIGDIISRGYMIHGISTQEV